MRVVARLAQIMLGVSIMNTDITPLTEKDAAVTYVRGWNRLDCAEFLKSLAPNAHYASQWVFARGVARRGNI